MMDSPIAANITALEQTEIPPELYLPFRGLRSVPLFFSDYCRKLTTHKGVTITRVIICTSEHFYLCHPNGDILRCFPFTAISKLFHDEPRHQIGIVVPCEFDLAVETPLSFQLLHVVDVLRRMHGARVPLEMVRVEPVPRPEGMLGFRADGSIIWDQKKLAGKQNKALRKKSGQTCMQKALDTCGLQDAWIGFKDGCYRYYRRAMRALDLGIEDDDEVLTTTAAASLSAATSTSVAAAATGSGGQVQQVDTMMLAAGRTSFAFAKGGAGGDNSEKSFRGGDTSGGDSDDDRGGGAGDADDTRGSAASGGNNKDGESNQGYRWFRQDKSLAKQRKARQQHRQNLATDTADNEVLNLLLSPMLAEEQEMNSLGGSGLNDNGSGSSSSSSSLRDEWWPGCQIGWADGPYALTLAKPKGFHVALDQKNSEFA